jgi:Domain of unknown function (DUF4262)
MQLGGDDRTREDIAKYGCSVMHVMAEGELPPFAYSIGIAQQTGAPEVVVIGLKRPMAHFMVNEYNRRVRAGERFASGTLYSGFLEGFDVFLEEVPLSVYEDYFGQNLDFYGGHNFQVLQIIYPTTKGIWPWAEGAPESFEKWQPILANIGRA